MEQLRNKVYPESLEGSNHEIRVVDNCDSLCNSIAASFSHCFFLKTPTF